MVFNIAALICHLATGIACAVLAYKWRQPPELCVVGLDVCDIIPLTVTNALQCVSVKTKVMLKYIQRFLLSV